MSYFSVNQSLLTELDQLKKNQFAFVHSAHVTHRPKKHCHSGLFCEASSESLAPNNLASSRTTARRSSPSLLCTHKNKHVENVLQSENSGLAPGQHVAHLHAEPGFSALLPLRKSYLSEQKQKIVNNQTDICLIHL